MSTKKVKRAKAIPMSLHEFNATVQDGKSPSAGQNVVYAPKAKSSQNYNPTSWADEVEEDELITEKERLLLPSGPRASRGPNFDESTIPREPPFTAHIGNLPYETTESDVYQFFADLDISELRLMKDHENQRIKGFGYVTFTNREDLINALHMNEATLKGRAVRIQPGKPSERDSGPGGERRRGGGGNYPPPDETPDDWRAAMSSGSRPSFSDIPPPPLNAFSQNRRNDFNSEIPHRQPPRNRGGFDDDYPPPSSGGGMSRDRDYRGGGGGRPPGGPGGPDEETDSSWRDERMNSRQPPPPPHQMHPPPPPSSSSSFGRNDNFHRNDGGGRDRFGDRDIVRGNNNMGMRGDQHDRRGPSSYSSYDSMGGQGGQQQYDHHSSDRGRYNNNMNKGDDDDFGRGGGRRNDYGDNNSRMDRGGGRMDHNMDYRQQHQERPERQHRPSQSQRSERSSSPSSEQESSNKPLDREPPKERKRLVIAPRTVDKAPTAESAGPSSIFGGAKPVDTAAREREIEEKLAKLSVVNSTESVDSSSTVEKGEKERDSHSEPEDEQYHRDRENRNFDSRGPPSSSYRERDSTRGDTNGGSGGFYRRGGGGSGSGGSGRDHRGDRDRDQRPPQILKRGDGNSLNRGFDNRDNRDNNRGGGGGSRDNRDNRSTNTRFGGDRGDRDTRRHSPNEVDNDGFIRTSTRGGGNYSKPPPRVIELENRDDPIVKSKTKFDLLNADADTYSD